jgi:hypothetical protein
MTHTINTITVSMPAGLEKYIRVFGNASDPHFCGKDVYEILEIKDFKDSLQKTVKENHKKELKTLLEEESNGPIYSIKDFKDTIFNPTTQEDHYFLLQVMFLVLFYGSL